MIDSLGALPPHLREKLASALDTGLLPRSPSATTLRSILGLRTGGEELAAGLKELETLGVTGRGAAAWLRALTRVGTRTHLPDLVWSGPELPGVPARDTRRVYDELLGTATTSLWVSTYAYFDGPQVFDQLAQRMDAVPSLNVVLLLNIERRRGDTTASDNLVRRFADSFWGTDWPGSSRPSVYYDPRSLDQDGPGGVLHAKAVVTDAQSVFVTSANLTNAALDRNIELGILVRDRSLAASVTGHLVGLIDSGLLLPLPV
ncbi:MAG: DISARM system phospholipase D-like protein DrmC [Gammaproteobacteria bacterium]|nr:DISARM system phospholipase D-like protein DrmC [Gammaproteobacteria bacterium]MDE0441558.1 DISARM system phospholipase D-like protein DrmC [Gammaproteobacteria bacterium]